MAELIADLPSRVIDSEGCEFYVSVVGNPRLDGGWEGWLEYVPFDESEVLLTRIETTQSNRSALERWAAALTDTYVQGAFQRAVAATPDLLGSHVVARRADVAAIASATTDLPDPFELIQLGTDRMRARLNALPRVTLLSIIAASGLNPAGKSLTWLSARRRRPRRG